MLAFNGLKQIMTWSLCVDIPELHATDESRQGMGKKPRQNERRRVLRIRSHYGFFRRIRVRSGLAKTPVVPTAQSVPFGVAVIPCRRLLEFEAFGLGTKFQFEPLQFSVRVD